MSFNNLFWAFLVLLKICGEFVAMASENDGPTGLDKHFSPTTKFFNKTLAQRNIFQQ